MHSTEHILMGDVTASSQLPSKDVARDLSALINTANARFADALLSPLTITLGDEFQGIVRDARSALDLILFFETMRLKKKAPELHYAWVFGAIETDINPKIAHGMLGAGLTEARRLLTDKSRSRPKAQVRMSGMPDASTILENSLTGLFGLTGRWKDKDLALASDLLEDDDIAAIAARHDRDVSSIYRRKDTLMIDEVRSMIRALTLLCATIDAGRLDA